MAVKAGLLKVYLRETRDATKQEAKLRARKRGKVEASRRGMNAIMVPEKRPSNGECSCVCRRIYVDA